MNRISPFCFLIRIFSCLLLITSASFHSYICGQTASGNRLEITPDCTYPITLSDSISFELNFQNTTLDTLYSVGIELPLDFKWDTTSFTMTGASHPYTVRWDGPSTLVWEFNGLQLPPDSTGAGFVTFQLVPLPTFLPGDTLFHQATITLDSSQQVVTPTAKFYQKYPLAFLYMIRRVTCHNGDDAWVQINTRDFGPGIEYSLDGTNWQSSPDFMNVGNGMYQGHARDSLGNYDMTLGIWLPNAHPIQPSIFLVNDTFSTGVWSSYQWKLNDVPIPGAIERKFKPWFTGWYSVTVTDTSGCPGTSEDSLYIFVSREKERNEPLRISPNPVQSILTAQLPEGFPHSELYLKDLYGRTLLKEKIGTQKTHSINCEPYPKGIYILEVITPQGIKFRQKFILEL